MNGNPLSLSHQSHFRKQAQPLHEPVVVPVITLKSRNPEIYIERPHPSLGLVFFHRPQSTSSSNRKPIDSPCFFWKEEEEATLVAGDERRGSSTEACSIKCDIIFLMETHSSRPQTLDAEMYLCFSHPKQQQQQQRV